MIQVCSLKKQFNNIMVLDDVNIDFNTKEVTCILGPSGAGKSTFLRCLNLLEEPTAGKILYNGKNTLDENFDV